MGYYIKMTDNNFVIKKENFNVALEDLKKIFIPENMTCYDYINGEKYPHFSWVTTDIVLNSKTLGEALSEIRYKPSYDENGNIINVEFTGEKYGDEDIFFSSIAKYVEPKSYIKFVGEDNNKWTWLFNDGKVNMK